MCLLGISEEVVATTTQTQLAGNLKVSIQFSHYIRARPGQCEYDNDRTERRSAGPCLAPHCTGCDRQAKDCDHEAKEEEKTRGRERESRDQPSVRHL